MLKEDAPSNDGAKRLEVSADINRLSLNIRRVVTAMIPICIITAIIPFISLTGGYQHYKTDKLKQISKSPDNKYLVALNHRTETNEWFLLLSTDQGNTFILVDKTTSADPIELFVNWKHDLIGLSDISHTLFHVPDLEPIRKPDTTTANYGDTVATTKANTGGDTLIKADTSEPSR